MRYKANAYGAKRNNKYPNLYTFAHLKRPFLRTF